MGILREMRNCKILDRATVMAFKTDKKRGYTLCYENLQDLVTGARLKTLGAT